MQITWSAYTVAKYGNQPDENEDAFWTALKAKSANIRKEFRCCISDGATRTSFSSLWARLLVDTVGRSQTGLSSTIISDAQNKWTAKINLMDLPWHAEEKVKQGSFATLLWFRIRKGAQLSGGPWRVFAIGDSCIVQIRGENIIEKHPIQHSTDFNRDPILISSLQHKNQFLEKTEPKPKTGKWLSGDDFFLMTDAFAQWFLKTHEDGGNPADEIKLIINDAENSQIKFDQWINQLRTRKLIRNDDTTLLWVKPSDN